MNPVGGRLLVCSMLGVFLIIGLVSCGSSSSSAPTGTVTGTVYIVKGGKKVPLTAGRVIFNTGTHSPETEIMENGTYELRVPLGEVKVTIQPPLCDDEPPNDDPDAPPRAKKGITIPEQYRDLDRTPLKLEVKEGMQTFDIPIK